MSIDTARSVHFMKFAASDLSMVWHYSRTGFGSSYLPAGSSGTAPKDDIPRFFSMDSLNPREFYLMGKFRTGVVPTQVGYLFRINKNDGKMLY